MELFAGKLPPGNPGLDPDFDNFGHSWLATFQLVTLEDWPLLAARLKAGTSWWAMAYVFAVVFAGRIVLMNLFVRAESCGAPHRAPESAQCTVLWRVRP